MKPQYYFLILVIFLFSAEESFACTAFCLHTNNEIILAKNLDWPIDEGYLFINERGINKSVLNIDTRHKYNLSWQSKYRSLTFNQFGKEFPLGGMNEQGLVVEELNTTTEKFIRDSKKHEINEFQLVQYILDKCQTVNEVIEQLNRLQCRPIIQQLHYLMADRLGNVLVVEFNGCEFNFYNANQTGFPILSNNRYNESLKYLSKFKGFGGDLPIRNRPGSNERFVTVAHLLTASNFQSPVNYSFQILDSVKQKDTKWSIFYDIKNLTVNFKFHNCETVKIFDFKKLADLDLISGLGGNLADCKFVSSTGLSAVSKEENSGLIQNILLKLQQEMQSKPDSNVFRRMADFGNQFLRNNEKEQE
ncbi:linear amide C-N hydrolase [Draconibacterium sp.]|nr:linear amide C-N hydrolase [Draconibacterium sp.]